MASTEFCGSHIHPSLVDQPEDIERAEESSSWCWKHLPQVKKYVIGDPVATFSGTKISTCDWQLWEYLRQPQDKWFEVQSLRKWDIQPPQRREIIAWYGRRKSSKNLVSSIFYSTTLRKKMQLDIYLKDRCGKIFPKQTLSLLPVSEDYQSKLNFRLPG